MGNTYREKSGGKGSVRKLERKRRALPAEQERWSMVVKKSTARAAQGLQEKSFMPGVQLPPEHRSACCSWQLCFCKILDKLRRPV